MPTSIRVHIVSHIRLYREGLARVLEKEQGIKVLETAAAVDQSLALVHEVQPDVVLLDMAMPEALYGVRVIGRDSPETKVVALGVAETEKNVLSCAEAGVAGYVLREASIDDLVATILRAARGELQCSTRTAGQLLRRVAVLSTELDRNPEQLPLTPRQREVLNLLTEGLTNKEIAARLGITVNTAKNHVHAVLEKLDVHSRGQAFAKLRRRRSRLARLED